MSYYEQSHLFRLSLNFFNTNCDKYGFYELPGENYEDFNKFTKQNKIIKLIICVTLYNESKKSLDSTLDGILENVEDFNDFSMDNKEILVIVIADGYSQLSNELKNSLSLQEKIEDNEPPEIINWLNNNNNNNNYILCKLLKYQKNSTNLVKNNDFLNVIFSIKRKNAMKINSHLFFFIGFCHHFSKEHKGHAVLLDCGTIPQKNSLALLYLALEKFPDLAGVCGELRVDENGMDFYSVLAAQYFEYMISHVLDKYFENFFQFIPVLPGAFSAYKLSFIDSNIFNTYFKPLCNSENIDTFDRNKYLAEDRVFCLELFVDPSRKNILKFIPDAIAITDGIDNLCTLMAQRRRWINGSWFALLHVLQHSCKSWKTQHSFCEKIIFQILIIYYYVVAFTNMLSLGLIYISLFISYKFTFINYPEITNYAMFIFALILLVIIIASMSHNKPKTFENLYRGITITLSLYFLISIGSGFYGFSNFLETYAGKDDTSYIIYLSTINILCYLIPILLNLEIMCSGVLRGLIAYIIYLPSYLILFQIFAFTNVDDLTWGNRESEVKFDEISENNKHFKLKWLSLFFGSNFTLAYFFTKYITDSSQTILNYNKLNNSAKVLALLFTIILVMKSFFATLDRIVYLIRVRPNLIEERLRQRRINFNSRPSIKEQNQNKDNDINSANKAEIAPNGQNIQNNYDSNKIPINIQFEKENQHLDKKLNDENVEVSPSNKLIYQIEKNEKNIDDNQINLIEKEEKEKNNYNSNHFPINIQFQKENQHLDKLLNDENIVDSPSYKLINLTEKNKNKIDDNQINFKEKDEKEKNNYISNNQVLIETNFNDEKKEIKE